MIPLFLRYRRQVNAAFLFLITALPQISAATFYIDYAGGADTNSGTATTLAWKHCPGDSAASGLAAMTALQPGDSINFKGGVTYVFTGSAGIALRWNGLAGNPITYDGNSSGAWGVGRARFTDNQGGNAITAFSAQVTASHLSFKNLDIGAIGGAATLPPDLGIPVAAKFGGGIAFNGGATGITIDGCAFHDLGYTFNQKPMSAASIAGSGVAFRNSTDLTISNCTFARVATGIDMTGSTLVSNLKVTSCAFLDSVVWTINQPTGLALSALTIFGCSETSNGQFDRATWTGYGESPRVVAKTADEGSAITLTASAVALPSATYQWRKNGAAINGATSASLTLSPATVADSALYTLVASNSAGSTISNEIALTITGSSSTLPANNVAPVITLQPASVTVAPYSEASFTVAATGSPAPTYLWTRNGITFPGWNTATIMLSGVSTNDVGTYFVTVTNAAGSVMSTAATLSLSTISTEPTTVAPVITTQPTSQTAIQGATVSFFAAASGTPAPTYQWTKNGSPVAGGNTATLTLTNITSNEAGTYVVIASNSAGSATSTGATLSLSSGSSVPTSVAPVITTQPASQTVVQGATVTFTAAASGNPAPTYQWSKNGSPVAGGNTATLTLTNVTSNEAGTYVVTASNSAGSASSNGATLSINSDTAPVITTQPVSQAAASKTTVTFTAGASGSPTPTFQWTKDGTPIIGATSTTLTLTNVNKGSAGSYRLVAKNTAGSATSSAATLTIRTVKTAASSLAIDEVIDSESGEVPATDTRSRLVNLSVRSTAGVGADSLIVGFVVSDGSSKSLLIRGAGPALTDFGVTGTVADPALSLYSGSSLLASNDDWSASPDAGEIAPAGNRVGAFPLASQSRDAAILAHLAAGAYTTEIKGKEGTANTALVELYDVASTVSSRLVNVSARTTVSGENTPVIGFIVEGSEPVKLLVRAIGPGLAPYGVDRTLADPQIEIFSGSTSVQKNDNWNGSLELTAAFQATGAFPLENAASKDAAAIFTAAAGAYTVVVTGAGATSGAVLVEVYELR